MSILDVNVKDEQLLPNGRCDPGCATAAHEVETAHCMRRWCKVDREKLRVDMSDVVNLN
jgi:hypothetical protein